MSVGVNIIQNVPFVDVENGLRQPKNAHDLVAHTREVFKSKKTFPLAFRKKQLKNLEQFLKNEEEALCKAVYDDLKKPKAETIIHELTLVQTEIRIALSNIDDWAKPQQVKKTVLNFFDDLYIYSDPLGVVLVIGAWNYPLQLTLAPLVGKLKVFFEYTYLFYIFC